MLLSNRAVQLCDLPVLEMHLLRLDVAGEDVPIVMEWLRLKFLPERNNH